MLVQPRGQSSIVTFLVVAGAIILLYCLILFSPAWIDNLSVREAAAAASTRGFSMTDDVLTQVILSRLNFGPEAVGYHFEEDDEGNRVEVRGMGIEPENVSFLREDATRKLTVIVDYDREVRLWPTRKYKKLHFHVEKENTF